MGSEKKRIFLGLIWANVLFSSIIWKKYLESKQIFYLVECCWDLGSLEYDKILSNTIFLNIF